MTSKQTRSIRIHGRPGSPEARRFLARLLGGVSLVALVAVSGAMTSAEAQTTLSGAIANRATQQGVGAANRAGTNGTLAGQLTQQQQRQVTRTLTDLNRAAVTLRGQIAAQAAARAAQASTGAVADGLTKADDAIQGLTPYKGLGRNPNDPTDVLDPSLAARGIVWQGAGTPTTVNGDPNQVQITQTDQRAILTWNSFNVGVNTTLTFNQPSANASALNRVLVGAPDPLSGARATQGAAPSNILGRIQSNGEVIVVNQAGITVGPKATIQTGSFVASSLDYGTSAQLLAERNDQYLSSERPIFSAQQLLFVDATGTKRAYADRYFVPNQNADVLRFDGLEGPVTVLPGAQISTNPIGLGQTLIGRIALLGPDVSNGGTLSAPDGQILVGSGRLFSFEPNVGTFNPNLTGVSGGTVVVPTNIPLDDQNNRIATTYDPNIRGVVLNAIPANQLVTSDGLFSRSNVPASFTASNGQTITPGRFFSDRTTPAPGPIAGGPRDPSLQGFGPYGFVNTGILQTDRGSIQVQATTIEQNGVAQATTSIDQNGAIYLFAADVTRSTLTSRTTNSAGTRFAYTLNVETIPGSVRFGQSVDGDGAERAVTAILPDTRLLPPAPGSTTPTVATLPSDPDSRAGFLRSVIAVSANRIAMDANSLIVAPSGRVFFRPATNIREQGANFASISASGFTTGSSTTSLAEGAVIDVAGLPEVDADYASLFVSNVRIGQNELSDSPLQRGGSLFRQRVVLDTRVAGTRADGTSFRGSQLFNANAVLQGVSVPVQQLLTPGGEISFQGNANLAPNSVLSAGGGFTRYSGGFSPSSFYITAGATRIVAQQNANPNTQYLSVLGEQALDHPRWGVTSRYSVLLNTRTPGVAEAEYVNGAAGGTIRFSADLATTPLQRQGQTPYASQPNLADISEVPGQTQPTRDLQIGSAVLLGAVQGPYQRAGSRFPSTPPRAGSLLIDTLAADRLDFVPDLDTGALIARDPGTGPTQLSVAALNDSGAATIRIGRANIGRSPGNTLLNSYSVQDVGIGVDSALALPDGGSFTLNANRIAIAGSVTSRAGSITISGNDVTLGATGRLDVSGRYVNDTGATRDTLFGRDYINGGSVTFTSTTQIPPSQTQLVQGSNLPLGPVGGPSLVLGAGSVIDLRSGGYVQTNGRLATDGNGVPVGRGGNLSINLATAPVTVRADTASLPTDQQVYLRDGRLAANGTILGNGFQGGGGFRLDAGTVVFTQSGQLGGQDGVFTVPAAFLQSGFGAYQFFYGATATVQPGVTLQPTQTQFIANSGAGLARSIDDAATPGTPIGIQRSPVNLSIQAQGLPDVINGDGTISLPAGFPVTPTGPSSFTPNRFGFLTDSFSLPGSSAIIADPGARVAIRSIGQLTVDGSISAPGGAITLVSAPATFEVINITTVQFDYTALTLGPNASLSTAGALLADPRPTARVTGRLLDGGTITLASGGPSIDGIGGANASANGNLAITSGAVIDVSGVSVPANALARTSPLAGALSPAAPVASDGGTITVQAANAALDGILRANAGNAGGVNGTLVLIATANGTQIVADGNVLPAGYRPGQPLPANFSNGTNRIILAASKLAGSGIDALNITRLPTTALFTPSPTTVNLAGSVDLSLARSLTIQADSIRAAANSVVAGGAPGSFGQAVLSAPYVALIGADNPATPPIGTTQPAATLAVSGTDVDVRGYFGIDGFSETTLDAIDAVRGTPHLLPTGGLGTQQVDPTALLATSGNLLVRAGQTYPASGTRFILQSTAANGRIRFESPSAAVLAVPYSAGGVLVASARTVEQAGVIRAPSGSIYLGLSTTQLAASQALQPGFRSLPSTSGFQPTTSVTLVAGSVTSAGTGGLLLPFGQTVNLTTYNAGTAGNLLQPPAKSVVLDGATVTSQPGAVIDLSGGGDLFATEFVAGLGGSRDVRFASLQPTPTRAATSGNRLTLSGSVTPGTTVVVTVDGRAVSYTAGPNDTINTVAAAIADARNAQLNITTPGANFSSAANGVVTFGNASLVTASVAVPGGAGQVYAVLPGFQASAAPVDYQGFSSQLNPLDPSINQVGRTVTLSTAAGGLPAGTYTLLPGAYLSLPGAYRVELIPGSTNFPAGASTTAADGTVTVTGRLGYGAAGQSSQTNAFTVQAAEVWQQYTEIATTLATPFFTNLAQQRNLPVPRLLADAGRLSVLASSAVQLGGSVNFAGAPGGRGGQLDLAAPRVLVSSSSGQAAPGTLVLTADQVNGLGAQSILLGGLRNGGVTGDLVTNLASNVTIDLQNQTPLQVSELILAAAPSASGGTTGDGEVEIVSGSQIIARGTPDPLSPQALVFGTTDTSGDGAAVRVSASGPLAVNRVNSSGVGGVTRIGANVVLDGSNAIEITSAQATFLDVAARLAAPNISVTGNTIAFVDATGAGAANAALRPTFLSGARSVTIRGSRQVSFSTSLALANNAGTGRITSFVLDAPQFLAPAAAGSTILVDATSATLTNSAGALANAASVVAATAPTGTLTINADQATLGGLDLGLVGFNDLRVQTTETLRTGVNGVTGTVFLPGGVTFDSAQLVIATGSTQGLTSTTAGTFTLTDTNGLAPSAVDDIGGRLNLDFGSVVIASDVSARAGIVDIIARTGNVTIADGTVVDLSGYTQNFYDRRVVLGGGAFRARIDRGSFAIAPSGRVSVAAQPDGSAGSVAISLAGPGAVALPNGTLLGSAGIAGAPGANFTLDMASAVDFPSLQTTLSSGGFTGDLSVRSGAGDLLVASALRNSSVSLTADGGRLDVMSLIDASGPAAGKIALFGQTGVTLAPGAELRANASDPTKRAGQITIGTAGTGVVDLAPGSLITLLGGSPYGSGGGTVRIRVPFTNVATGATSAHRFAASVNGATQIIYEPYQTVTTARVSQSLVNQVAALPAAALAATRAQIAGLSAGPGTLVFVQPGIDFVNPTGDIAIGLLPTRVVRGQTVPIDPNTTAYTPETIDFSGIRYAGVVQGGTINGAPITMTPGTFTVRASGNIRVDASISDGFTSPALDADLLQDTLSWSYRFVAGANAASANPLGVGAATSFETGGAFAGRGDFIFGPYVQQPVRTGPNNPTLRLARPSEPLGPNEVIRTGTGSIDVAAARNVVQTSRVAAIYTAGVQAPTPAGFRDVPPPQSDFADAFGLAVTTANTIVPNAGRLGYTVSAPAFPTRGGDLTINAGNDLLGANTQDDPLNLYAPAIFNRTGGFQRGPADYTGQFLGDWLRTQGGTDPAGGSGGTFGNYSTPFSLVTPDDSNLGRGRQSALYFIIGAFQQGFATLGGGDLTVTTGRDVSNASFVVPNAFRVINGIGPNNPPQQINYGGGRLIVRAGGNIDTSVFTIDRGDASITAGNGLTASRGFSYGGTVAAVPVGNIINFGDANILVRGRTGAIIGGLNEIGSRPSTFGYAAFPRPNGTIGNRSNPGGVFSTSTPNTSIDAVTTAGNLGIQPNPNRTFSGDIFPATTRLAAARGSVIASAPQRIVLPPSPNGGLEVLSYGTASIANIRISDRDPASLARPITPGVNGASALQFRLDLTTEDVVTNADSAAHDAPQPLHFNDPTPSFIYSLTGDVAVANPNRVSGAGSSSQAANAVEDFQGVIDSAEPFQIIAARDVPNLDFRVQNVSVGSLSFIQAGRDFGFTTEQLRATRNDGTPPVGRDLRASVLVTGPGQFVLTTGRNLTLSPSSPSLITGQIPGQGIITLGNVFNPVLPEQGASITTLFGVAPGIATDALIARYVDPANAGAVPTNYAGALTDYVNRLLADYANERGVAVASGASFSASDALAFFRGGTTPEAIAPLDTEDALAFFRGLQQNQQLLFLLRDVYFPELRAVSGGANSLVLNDPGRAFNAIETLFPTDLYGPTDARARTGNLAMQNALVATEAGGDITFAGPGGNALIGGLASLSTLPVDSFGILTIRNGAINGYTDGDVSVFNSRILTVLGGELTLFSGNGSIDAGRGTRASQARLPLATVFDRFATGFADLAGFVAGSGIGTIASVPGAPPGDVFLLAPRGDIDAGDAGIRSSGNVVIGALRVLNAENITAAGTTSGVVQAPAVSISALSSAGASTAQTAQALGAGDKNNRQPTEQRYPSIIQITLRGFGEPTDCRGTGPVCE